MMVTFAFASSFIISYFLNCLLKNKTVISHRGSVCDYLHSFKESFSCALLNHIDMELNCLVVS